MPQPDNIGDTMKLSDIDLLDIDRFRRQEHHEMFSLLRREAPVFWHEEPGDRPGFWAVTKHADLVEVNRNAEVFSSEAKGFSMIEPDVFMETAAMDNRGVMMLATDPPKHTRYRRLVSKGFTPRMISRLEAALEIRARDIVNNVIERGKCDFVVDLASELPLQAIAEIMGVPQADRGKLFDWSNQIIGYADPEFQAEKDSATAALELYAYVHNLAEQRLADPQDDIVTLLLNATIGDDRLTELEFDAFMLLMTIAGNETTRNATSGGMLALLQNPDQLAKLLADIDGKLDLAIEEILRWVSPIMFFRRTATEDYQLESGHQFKKGDKVVMWHISANRDEDVFEDPFTFDIERDPNEHIAFGGGGPHYCLGANLAKSELRIIFREILTRMHDIQLAGEPDFLRSHFLAGIKHMPVTFAPGKQVAAGTTEHEVGETVYAAATADSHASKDAVAV